MSAHGPGVLLPTPARRMDARLDDAVKALDDRDPYAAVEHLARALLESHRGGCGPVRIEVAQRVRDIERLARTGR